MILSKFSIGVGDRFNHGAPAQLAACRQMLDLGIEVVPVWNKSHREHTIIGSEPASVRKAADAAVVAAGWTLPYHVDADHIGLATVDGFLDSSDFFTIDVADFIGQAAPEADINAFVGRHPELIGTFEIPGISEPLEITRDDVAHTAATFLFAVQKAAEVFRYIESRKGPDSFIPEISMDETVSPQTPPELLVILAAIADLEIPIQTIAPKFSGEFHKGVDYIGDPQIFAREFDEDLCVIAHAVAAYGLPQNLKLSVHSGSDKFSIYPCIRESLQKRNAGVHLKTAGTNWLEELIGLAEADGEGLAIAQRNLRPVTRPHRRTLRTIRHRRRHRPLPTPPRRHRLLMERRRYADALRHDQACPSFNPHLRQLLHIGFKIAAEMGPRYIAALEACAPSITRNTTANLVDRHLRPLLIG
jgi:hypothetical protein